MTITVCDACQQRYSLNDHNGDFIHRCESANTTLDFEDVVNFGRTQEDPDGTTFTGPGPSEQLLLGTPNTLQGTRAGIEGADDDLRTDRGNKVSVYRTRRRFVYKPSGFGASKLARGKAENRS